MPKTVQIQLYSLGELKTLSSSDKDITKKATDRAFNWAKNKMLGDNWDAEIIEVWETALKSIGMKGLELNYSGFDGDKHGASFTGHCDIKILLETINKHPNGFPEFKNPNLYDRLKQLADKEELEVWIFRNSNYYYNEQSCSVDGSISNNENSKKDWALLDRFITLFNKFRIRVCQMIYDELKNSYEQLTDDDTCISYCENNDYLFLKNGRRLPIKVE